MENYYNYLIMTSVSISIFYLAYLFFFRKEQNFRLLRIFLFSAILLSLLLPMNPVSINLSFLKPEKSILTHINTGNETVLKLDKNEVQQITIPVDQEIKKTNSVSEFSYQTLAFKIYVLVCLIFIVRLILSMSKILYFYFSSERYKYQQHTIILLNKRIIAFSFFNWIFVDKQTTGIDLAQIIKHEKVHASQYHSIDLLLSELLVATFWFNPFAWMFKKAFQQVHEFLADEGVLDSGFNRLEYQALLVNQAAEERLVAVSSNFSYSLIKKRIMMMSKTKKQGGTGIKLLILIPLATVIFIMVAAFKTPNEVNPTAINKLINPNKPIDKIELTENKLVTIESVINKTEIKEVEPRDTTPKNQQYIAAVSPTKMNVLYIGVDNPVSIAVTGAKNGKITAEIDNGTITGENGAYIARVKQNGIANITVKVDGKEVSKQTFRIKSVPDPIAIINGKWNQFTFTKQELIDAGGIAVMLTNFDFDLKFDAVEFTLSAIDNGYVTDSKSNGSKFSKKQIELINATKPGGKIYIEEIKARGPDGTIRMLGAIALKIQ